MGWGNACVIPGFGFCFLKPKTNMLKLLFSWSFVLLLSAASDSVHADLVVIANAEIQAESVSREEVINIYMGRLRRFPSGEAAQPIDLANVLPEKALFYRLLVNKNLADIDAYWARLVFSGRASPPATVTSLDEMIQRVALNSNAIGYIDRQYVLEHAANDNRIKIILDLPEGSGQ